MLDCMNSMTRPPTSWLPLADALDHPVDRDVVGQELVRVEGDLILLDEGPYTRGDNRAMISQLVAFGLREKSGGPNEAGVRPYAVGDLGKNSSQGWGWISEKFGNSVRKRVR